jgi:hypothetical protein
MKLSASLAREVLRTHEFSKESDVRHTLLIEGGYGDLAIAKSRRSRDSSGMRTDSRGSCLGSGGAAHDRM